MRRDPEIDIQKHVWEFSIKNLFSLAKDERLAQKYATLNHNCHYTMLSNDWKMTDDIVKLDQGYYFGEISKENNPNGFGILLSNEGLEIDEGYWEQGLLCGLAW